MDKVNLKVITSAEYDFLETRKPKGVYNLVTRKKLYHIIKKLKHGKKYCSRLEKKLYRAFKNANFGILLENNMTGQQTIQHSGQVQISGKFVGKIIAQAVLIKKNASVAANIAAEVVMCRGKVFGDIRATHKIKISSDAVIKGNIHSPNFIIEKGATFDGRCSMPNIKKFSPFPLFGDVARKIG